MIRIVAALLLVFPVSSAFADTHIDNINGIAVDREGAISRFAGMVIDEEGRITELLDAGDMPSREIAFYVDGDKRVVAPGFVDAHAHIMEAGLATLTLDLSQTNTLDEALAQLAAYSAAHPERPWLLGTGWDQERWGLQRLPNAAQLDAVVSDRPVWLIARDGNAGWGNTLALAAGQITAKSEDPTGGRIVRLEQSRQPSGVLIGKAMDSILSAIPPPLPEDRALALHNAQEMFLARGVTAVADMGTSIEDWMTYRRAGDAGRLQMRIIAYADDLATMLLIGGPAPSQWLYNDRLRLNGLQFQLDGTLGPRAAWLKQPYADAPDERGLIFTNGTQLRNLMSRAALDGFQVAIRASGDAAIAEGLNAIEELSADYAGDRRWRIEHLDVVDPADLARVNALAVIASVQPAEQSSHDAMALARLGRERFAGTQAWRSIGKAAGALVLGSGAPSGEVNPLAGLAQIISPKSLFEHGSNADSVIAANSAEPAGSLPRAQALAASTAAAAYAAFAEGRFGALAQGERADFVVLSADPLTTPIEDISTITVMETWIAGQRVFAAEE